MRLGATQTSRSATVRKGVRLICDEPEDAVGAMLLAVRMRMRRVCDDRTAQSRYVMSG